jgi:hypothetical protein
VVPPSSGSFLEYSAVEARLRAAGITDGPLASDEERYDYGCRKGVLSIFVLHFFLVVDTPSS